MILVIIIIVIIITSIIRIQVEQFVDVRYSFSKICFVLKQLKFIHRLDGVATSKTSLHHGKHVLLLSRLRGDPPMSLTLGY